MRRDDAVSLVEALYGLRCGLLALGKRGAELARVHFTSAERDLTAVLAERGLPVGQTSEEADACKLALLKLSRGAPEPPASAPVTARLELDRCELVPEDTLVIVSGGLPEPLRWPDYVLRQAAPHRPHFEALRAAWESRPAGTAERPIFACSDGLRFSFTDRAWGDFLAALANGIATAPTATYRSHWP